jgi:integrase
MKLEAPILVSEARTIRLAETQAKARERIEYAWLHLEKHFGHKAIDAITTLDCLRYAKQRKAKASTARYELRELQTTINHLVRTKRIDSRIAPHITLPPAGQPRKTFLTTQDKARVLALAKQRREDPAIPSRVELFLHLGLESGQRRRAIETLEWDQVDFAGKVIHFLKEGEEQTKKRKVSVPMSTTLLAVLSAEHERRVNAWVLRASGSIRTAFESLMAAAELPDVTPHALRHTFVSHLLMRDIPVFTVAQLAGMTVKMVETTYGHLTTGHLRAALA